MLILFTTRVLFSAVHTHIHLTLRTDLAFRTVLT